MPGTQINNILVTSGKAVPEKELQSRLEPQSPLYFRYKGVKINFADIESFFYKSDLVKEVAVMEQEDIAGERKLVAYIVPSGPIDEKFIHDALAEAIPVHMMPQSLVILQSFPLNSQGSIDRIALRDRIHPHLKNPEIAKPSSPTEEKLVCLIEELLQIETINVHDNFFRIGGSSIQAVRIINAIRKEFNLDLDIKCFFVFPNARELSQHLDNLLQEKTEQKSRVTSDACDEKVGYTNSLVPLKIGTNGLPLYIVCGGGGTAFTFQNFAYMLDESQGVYVFQPAYDSAELAKFPDTIEEIATKYLEELMMVNPEGPYALSGHCIGGAIALEMAKKLKSIGKQVKMLALFDVILTKDNINPRVPVRKLRKTSDLLKQLTLNTYLRIDFNTFLLARHPKDAMEYKINRLKRLVRRIFRLPEQDAELVLFAKFEEIFRVAFENYRLEKYNGKLLIFYARDHYHFFDKERNIKFRKLALEDGIRDSWKDYGTSVVFYDVEGEHSTIFQSKDFANLLQGHLNS